MPTPRSRAGNSVTAGLQAAQQATQLMTGGSSGGRGGGALSCATCDGCLHTGLSVGPGCGTVRSRAHSLMAHRQAFGAVFFIQKQQ